MAAIVGPGGSSTATTFAVDGPGDQLWQGTTCGVTCHTNGQMHVCLIASLVKIITKCVAVVYRFKSVRMVSC